MSIVEALQNLKQIIPFDNTNFDVNNAGLIKYLFSGLSPIQVLGLKSTYPTYGTIRFSNLYLVEIFFKFFAPNLFWPRWLIRWLVSRCDALAAWLLSSFLFFFFHIQTLGNSVSLQKCVMTKNKTDWFITYVFKCLKIMTF